jgi:hypothetical protein
MFPHSFFVIPYKVFPRLSWCVGLKSIQRLIRITCILSVLLYPAHSDEFTSDTFTFFKDPFERLFWIDKSVWMSDSLVRISAISLELTAIETTVGLTPKRRAYDREISIPIDTPFCNLIS